MNNRTLHKISYGLYIVSSKKGDKLNGQIANTVFQITSEPPTIAVSINKGNLTHDYIAQSGVFTVSILSEQAPMELTQDKLVEAIELTGLYPLIDPNALKLPPARIQLAT